ncbi:hypothetical protein [Proteiniclasticum ruminis]|uniref:hypothetical protein n=2 Tax=Proteiniclasticum ruminis TaxID=398199 RepID=UPI0028B22E0B|nr:hypothetical protein [Proteiniclasticum ruminis]
MKGILMILSLLFLTACGAQEMAAGEAAVERDMVGVTESAPEEAAEAPAEAPAEEVLETAPKSAVNYSGQILDVMNFRTSDSLDMKSEHRIIRTYEEFMDYNEAYTILENPFFIDDESLNALQKVNEEYFKTQGFIAVILVESSGSNEVTGESLLVKGNVAEVFIRRRAAEIGTMDIATRHVLFPVSKEELKEVTDVKVTISLSTK